VRNLSLTLTRFYALLQIVVYCRDYETLQQRLRDRLGCKDCYTNTNLLIYLLTCLLTYFPTCKHRLITSLAEALCTSSGPEYPVVAIMMAGRAFPCLETNSLSGNESPDQRTTTGSLISATVNFISLYVVAHAQCQVVPCVVLLHSVTESGAVESLYGVLPPLRSSPASSFLAAT